MAAEPGPTDEGRPPLGSWPRLHALVLALLAALVALLSLLTWAYA